jgi:bacterioferritin-associated ferredoxin
MFRLTRRMRSSPPLIAPLATLSDIDIQLMESLYAPIKPTQPAATMLVCQCNMITSKEIEDIVLDLLTADPWQLVVPAMVYSELNRRAKCGGCVPNVVDIIVRVTENYHSQHAQQSGDVVSLPTGLEKLKQQRSGVRRERRSAGHRAA